ncbi:MAG: DUF5615 family PIN-like protein [Saprospiraceae bacterium]
MRLLLDANLSWRLAKTLSDVFYYIVHVDKVDLPVPAKDMEIWEYAKKHDLMIVTNDEDYYYLLSQKGFPPKVILLRMGNQSTKEITKVLTKHQQEILDLYETEDYGLLEIV